VGTICEFSKSREKLEPRELPWQHSGMHNLSVFLLNFVICLYDVPPYDIISHVKTFWFVYQVE